MVIEGMLALTGQHFIMDYNEREGTLPAFVEGFQNVARDEHRHVAFGSVFLREMAHEDDRYKQAIQRTLEESLPVADGVLRRHGRRTTTIRAVRVSRWRIPASSRPSA
jgi:ribonucleoside-diphosphate reductase beta chain